MNLSLQDLYKTFCERTRWTNLTIERGLASGLGVFEETITDVNLVQIAYQHDDYVLTRKFSRRQEGSLSGADWLWCIGEPGSWLSLLIQAKIINPVNSICYQLNYQLGKQRELLVNFAHQHNLLPLFCIYNYIPDGMHPPAKAAPSLSTTDPLEWACSLIIPKHVKNLVKSDKRRQIDLLNYGIPWSYPFYYAANAENSTLAEALAKAINKARADFDELDRRLQSRKRSKSRKPTDSANNSLAKIRTELDNPAPLLLVTPDLPKFATDLLKGRISPAKSPVAGISVVSKVPVRPFLQQRGALPTTTDDLWALALSEEEERLSIERKRKRL